MKKRIYYYYNDICIERVQTEFGSNQDGGVGPGGRKSLTGNGWFTLLLAS
jgi:hypothetical protein